ncbi:DUF288 domain-containing protein [Candidatus Microgenomates bacterium]|nr:DUF288 domain-containing protein [Candidatus Microgenomates bacterium]
MDKVIIITTINPPKEEIYKFAQIPDWKLICVGDTKTPLNWSVENVDYLSPEMQDKLFPTFSKFFPWKMYARKNLGYLYAIKNGAKVIGESDDDMFPDKNYPPDVSLEKKVTTLSGKKFINVYQYFLKNHVENPVWVRGFPLEFIKDQEGIKQKKEKVISPMQNSVQDKDSDFDAIYRFLYNHWLELKPTGNYALGKGSYAPMNTQNTFTHPMAYPLLYLPATSGFHVEDIIRGYIAQRILWEMDAKVVFTYPTAYTSNRNPHNYLDDFKLEVPLFLNTKKLIDILDATSLYKDPLESLLKVYRVLVKEKFFPKEELPIVTAWACEIDDLLNK